MSANRGSSAAQVIFVGRPTITGRAAAMIALWIGIFTCCIYACIGFTVKEDPFPVLSDIAPVVGTVESTRIYDNDERGTVFWFRLADGERFYYMDGNSRYRTITRLVQPGVTVKVWPWINFGSLSPAQLEVNDDLILTYEHAAQDYRDRAREGTIAGAVSAAIGICLTGILVVVIVRQPHRKSRRRAPALD